MQLIYWCARAIIAMQQYFPIRALEPSHDIILAPKSINLNVDDSKDFNEFKLYGK
jgi:hypothetical protein